MKGRAVGKASCQPSGHCWEKQDIVRFQHVSGRCRVQIERDKIECVKEKVRSMKRRKKEPENLCELGVGGRAVVTEIRSSGAMKRRLADMGILPGTVVCVQKMAPLGDPIQISIRGYELLLRGSEAREIMIRPIA